MSHISGHYYCENEMGFWANVRGCPFGFNASARELSSNKNNYEKLMAYL